MTIAPCMTLVAGGSELSMWESISVTASMKDATRNFSATVTEGQVVNGNFGSYWLEPGTPVKIYTAGVLLLDGYVNEYKPSFDAQNRSVTVSGRSKGQDSVDSSAKHETGTFKKKTAVEIANELAGKVGNRYFSEEQLPKIEHFQMNQGETVHQVARRLAAQYGYTIMGHADGSMEFCKAKNDVIGELGEGLFPTLGMSATLKDTKLYSNFEFKGQLAGREEKYGKDAAHHVSEVQDGRSTRYRPYIRVVEKAADSDQAKKRAEWQAKRISGDSATVEATIWGHFLGGLVEPNKRIFVRSGFLKISHEMLVEKVTWSQDDSAGTTAKISLVPPEAYDGKASSKSGKSKAKDARTGKDVEPSDAYSASKQDSVKSPEAGNTAPSVSPTPSSTYDEAPIKGGLV